MKKAKKNEVINVDSAEEVTLDEVLEAEVVEEDTEKTDEAKEEKKPPFWKSKKFLLGVGVLGGVAIAALSSILTKATSPISDELDALCVGSPCDDCDELTCDNCPYDRNDDDDSSDESSEE